MEFHTPRFYTKLFKRFCHQDLFEELQGDLEENFARNIEKRGIKKARRIYRQEVIKMIRPSVLKKKAQMKNSISTSLLKMHFKLTLRSMLRHRVFSMVNILGLAAAITISLFFVNIILTGHQLDRQFENLDKLYRIEVSVKSPMGDVMKMATLPYPAVDALKEDIPSLKTISHVRKSASATLKVNGSEIVITGIETDPAFLSLFDITAMQGNLADIYQDVNSIAITLDIAERLYPDTSPLGQVTKEGKVIRAVIPAPRGNSHFSYEMIGYLNKAAGTSDNSMLNNWAAYTDSYAYALIDEKSTIDNINDQLGSFTNRVNRLSGLEEQFTFNTRAVSGITFSEPGYYEIGTVIGREGLIFFLVMILIMMVISCFNYANLSIARALQRTKEIGMRKVAGSTNWQIKQQILTETICFSLIAFLLAISSYYYLSGSFSAVLPFFSNLFRPGLSPDLFVAFLLFAILTGIIAGTFPAFFFARINPLQLFNSRVKTKALSFVTLRKVLVTFQLTLSLFTVLFTLFMYNQVRHISLAPQGFATENRLIIKAEPEKREVLQSLVQNVAGVEAVTATSLIPGTSIENLTNFNELLSGDSSIEIGYFFADEQFDDVFKPKLLDGRFLEANGLTGPDRQVLVNNRFLELLTISQQEAVGKRIDKQEGSYIITGVIDEMAMGNPFMKAEEAIMIIGAKNELGQNNLTLTLSNQNDQVFNQLEQAWKDVYPDLRFEPIYLKSHLEKPLVEFYNLVKAMGFICLAIIAISLLGQLGMALYNAETRIKEIGVRKVLGARITAIAVLLLKGTLAPLAIATVLACPLSYTLYVQGITPDIRSPYYPGTGAFILGVGALALVVLVLVVSQTWRTATLNPSESLKYE